MREEQLVNEGCPDEWTLSRFVENRLDVAAAGEVLAHIAGCASCRAKAAGLGAWLARTKSAGGTVEALSLARKTWLRVQWRRIAERFRPDEEALAAADGQTGDNRLTANALGSGFIHFLSRTPRGLKDGWHVKLSIPARPTAKTLLRLTVLDGRDEPVSRGTLHFCRLPLAVADGHATMPLIDFQRNLGEAIISLRREDGADVPGDPVLGYDLTT